jgi:hypothetical protein
MATVVEFDTTVGLIAIFSIKRQQVVADLFDAGRRCQKVLPAIHAQVWPGNDQFVVVGKVALLSGVSSVRWAIFDCPPHSQTSPISRFFK